MNILFVDNLLFEGSRTRPRLDLQPHLGLMSLVAIAKAVGHEAAIYDMKYDVACGRSRIDDGLFDLAVASIIDRRTDIVGFTALGCNFPFVVRLAKAVKSQCPETTILLGGPHPTILHRETIAAFPWIDMVVRNEAEETLPQVLKFLEGTSTAAIPGVTFRDAHGNVISTPGNPVIAALDGLPKPAYDAYPIRALGLASIRVEAGRGCPFNCSFCSTATFFGREFRVKAADRIVDEMRDLNQQYGFVDFKLNHDLFTVNKAKVRAFCEAVTPTGFTWACSARMDCVDRKLLEDMAAAGCRRIYFGVETGSPRMQRISRKRLNLTIVEPMLAITEAVGIKTVTSFITGYPEETLDDHEQTLSMVFGLHCRKPGLNTSQLHLLTPEPGTELMNQYGSQLWLDDRVGGFNLPALSSEERQLIRAFPTLFSNYYSYPCSLSWTRARLAVSAFQCLVELHRDEMLYLLSLFHGDLGVWVQSLEQWRSIRREPSDVVGLFELADHVADTRGRVHPAVSILRLRAGLIAASEGAGGGTQSHASAQISRATKLVVGDSLTILPRIHEPQPLKEYVSAVVSKAVLEASYASIPLADIVIVVKRVDQAKKVDIFSVSPGVVELLRYFSRPANYWEYCARLSREPADVGYAEWDSVRDLIGQGVLVPCLDQTATASHHLAS